MVKVYKRTIGIEPIHLLLGEVVPGVGIVEPDCWLTPVLDGFLPPVLVCHLELLLCTCVNESGGLFRISGTCVHLPKKACQQTKCLKAISSNMIYSFLVSTLSTLQ